MQVDLQGLFKRCLPAYAARHWLHPREWRAAQCISGCYSGAFGAHTLSCPQGHFDQVQLHACRHRSCPKCAQAARVRWLQAQMERLLPCPHFHVVFTLPHSLLRLWERNRDWFIGALFDAARAALLQLLADPRHLGATPGVLMSLHTWGRTLSHHPHVHCLVSAGGVDAQGRWLATGAHWLLPVRALQVLFRGKLLHALREQLDRELLLLPPWMDAVQWRGQLRALHRKHFNIEISAPYAHGHGVLKYLARYAKGGPVAQSRSLQLVRGQVRMPYLDHRDKSPNKHPKVLRLSADEFIARVLWHAPPPRVHTTRHAGLYSSSRKGHHALAMAHLGTAPSTSPSPWPRPSLTPTPSTPNPAPPPTCPQCHAPLLRTLEVRPALRALCCTPAKTQFPGQRSHATTPSTGSTGPPPAAQVSTPDRRASAAQLGVRADILRPATVARHSTAAPSLLHRATAAGRRMQLN